MPCSTKHFTMQNYTFYFNTLTSNKIYFFPPEENTKNSAHPMQAHAFAFSRRGYEEGNTAPFPQPQKIVHKYRQRPRHVPRSHHPERHSQPLSGRSDRAPFTQTKNRDAGRTDVFFPKPKKISIFATQTNKLHPL